MILLFVGKKVEWFKVGVVFSSVPDDYCERYNKFFDLKWLQHKHGHHKPGFHLVYGKFHPVVFAKFMLGKTLRPYQSFAIDLCLGNLPGLCNGKRVAFNWARRLGKTTTWAVLSLWLTWYNLLPKNDMEKFTEVGVVSKEADAAKKLLTSTSG